LGNLPDNIAARLLADFIEKGRFFRRMVVTVQREVALRMAACPGSNDYSSFSVLCSSVYKVSLLYPIKASSFYPAPRVDSQGVCLDLLPLRRELPELFYPLVRSLFSSRRKIIKNTLSAFAAQVIMRQNNSDGENLHREAAEEVLNRTGISGGRRPETLEKDEFAALAGALEEFVLHD
jgi:16S rRNA (adenine1518-N6/adenine1519-N6)-dimethyltransferase